MSSPNIRSDGQDFSGQTMDHADLRNSIFSGCSFSGAALNGADFSSAVVRDCSLEGVSAAGARFHRAHLEDCSAEGADFAKADFTDAELTETLFTRAALRASILDSARGDGVGFRGANLTEASFRSANLFGPDFRGADLTNANFSGATLKGADFRGAILDGVDWTGTNLSNARFDAGLPSPNTTPSNAGPAATEALDAVQDLLCRAAADPRLARLGTRLEKGETEQIDPALLLQTLKRELKTRGIDVSETLAPFEQMLQALQSANGDEPPEQWKAWLESMMRNPPPELATILSKLQKP